MNWIEITTRIGCPNMCYYCPQTKLITQYKHSKKEMNIEDFKKYLTKINKTTTQIHFSGFSETFYNQDTFKMIRYAYEQGYQIVIYTTLEGNTNYKELKDVYVDELHIHYHPTANKSEIEKRAEKIIKYLKYGSIHFHTITDPISRASSNYKIERRKGILTCQRFNCNVLLPNGEVYMCCCDYGLQHKIGDLNIDEYDSPQFNIMRKHLRTKAMNEKEEILCRYCEIAQVI